MSSKVFVFDPTASDELSKVRGVGRYLQILRENFPKWTFAADLKQVSPDSIFINPFFNFLLSPIVTKKIAALQIAVIHDLIPLKYPSHFPIGVRGKVNVYLNKLALKNYDLIITDSQASKKDIIDKLKVKSEKVKVVYPCLPKKFAENKVSNSNIKRHSGDPDVTSGDSRIWTSQIDKANYCLYVGDATWNKNLVNLAKAIKLADVTCVFVGKVFSQSPTLSGGWQKELHQFLEFSKGDPRFIFPGFVPDQELIQLYKNANLNLLVSRDEGFGFSYLEASNFAIPSILSDIPVLRETAQDTALFANPDNPQDIADKIKELWSNDEINKTLGEEAKERTKFFSAANFKKEFVEVLNS